MQSSLRKDKKQPKFLYFVAFKIPPRRPCFWLVSGFLSRLCSIWDYEYLQNGNKTFRPKTIFTQAFLYTDVSTFSNIDKIKKWTSPHFQNMTRIRVSIIVSIPHCPTAWNTNDDKTLETGQNQEMFPHFQKMGKIKKCGYFSIKRRCHI